MNKTYTLISFMGTGMYIKEGGYRKTRYRFSDGSEYETKLFLEALLSHNCDRDIREVALAGSYTSGWDMLVDENDGSVCGLWCSVKEECESAKGVTEERLRELERYLEKRYCKTFRIYTHTPQIDHDTAEEIFSVYTELYKSIKPDSRILLDITHGFRSMPVLLYQALQFNSIGKDQPTVELVYGEYIDQEKISVVRDLSPFWEYSEITSAMHLFENRLDAKKLAGLLDLYWEKGAKCLKRFSEAVECNFSLQIPDILKQMKNAICVDLSGKPEWVKGSHSSVKNIYDRLCKKLTSETLFAFSEFLEEKGLITQSVIALQICAETAVTEKHGSKEYFGDYKWWQEHGKPEYDRIRREIGGAFRRNLYEVENLRNQIAHGGARDKNSKEFPSASNMPKILKNGKAAVQKLFEKLKEE